MIRLILSSLAILTLFISSTHALNQVRVFVPEDSLHGTQQVRAGHPNDIYVEVTNDIDLSEIKMTLDATNYSTGLNLWDKVAYSDCQFILSPSVLEMRSIITDWQDNIWPDPLFFRSYTQSSKFLQPGTTSYIKFSVIPHTLGNAQFIPSQLLFYDNNSQQISPGFISQPITVIPDYDCNNNGIQDFIDIEDGTSNDCNENYIPDECEALDDCNNNGILDVCEIMQDCNENGIPDECENLPDCNNNGIPDGCDFDCNFNGIPDDCETFNDCNCNGIPDEDDISSGLLDDANSNGIPDECDPLPEHYYRVVVPPNEFHGSQEMLVGFDEEIYILAHTDFDLMGAVVYNEYTWSSGTDLWDFIDAEFLVPPESFNLIKGFNYFDGADELADTLEGFAIALTNIYYSPGDFEFMKLTVRPVDTGTVTISNSHSYMNGDSSLFQSNQSQLYWTQVLADVITISYFPDCNNNLILDSIDIENGLITDCNNNYIADYCETIDNPSIDCNHNRIPDICDIENDPNIDCNTNGIPDECEVGDPSIDCNGNGIPDECDINFGYALDCNGNSIPDECDILNDPSIDCNGNSIPDICDLLSGFSEDCNYNGIVDECDYDCNLNGIPDECEGMTDCNCNGVADYIDVTTGWSDDTDNNNIPDECEGKAGNYIRIYTRNSAGEVSNELPRDIEGEIIFALTSVPGVDAVSLPISPLSEDNIRLWDYLNEENIEYLYQDYWDYEALSFLIKQYPQWPDSLLMSLTRYSSSQPLPANNTMPIIRLLVTPTTEGVLSWESIVIPPASNFSFVSTEDELEYPLELRFDPIIISCCRATRGNIDYDITNTIDIADIIYFVDYQFGTPSGPPPYCFDEADVDNSGSIDIADLIYLVAYQFQSGPPPLPCQN